MTEATITTPTGLSYEKASATFRAKYLHALEPVIRSSQGDLEITFSVAGLIVEPVETGGAVLIATDARVLAAIFDAKARATRPMRLTISDDLFAAVTPRPGISLYDQGDTFEMPLPEWAQPGDVYAWGLAAYVFGQMQHPALEEDEGGMLASILAEDGNVYAGGYRIHKEPPTVQWRSILAKSRTPSIGRVNVYPQMLARFERIERLHQQGVEMTFGGEGEPVILTIPGAPEFIGAMMPNRTPIKAPVVPTWAAQPAPELVRKG